MQTQILLTGIPVTEFQSLIAETVRNEVSFLKQTDSQAQNDELIKLNEVAVLLNVSKVTIHSWKKSGKIPFYRISNKVYFKKNEVLEALKKVNRRELL